MDVTSKLLNRGVMNIKRILGVIILVAGIAMLFTSNYIMSQVEEGKVKIADAEQKVGTAKGLFSLSPVTKELSKGKLEEADSKIEAGKGEVAHYEKMAGQLQMGGYILLGIGIIVVIFGRKKR